MPNACCKKKYIRERQEKIDANDLLRYLALINSFSFQTLLQPFIPLTHDLQIPQSEHRAPTMGIANEELTGGTSSTTTIV